MNRVVIFDTVGGLRGKSLMNKLMCENNPPWDSLSVCLSVYLSLFPTPSLSVSLCFLSVFLIGVLLTLTISRTLPLSIFSGSLSLFSLLLFVAFNMKRKSVSFAQLREIVL